MFAWEGGEKGRYKNPARPCLGITSQTDEEDATGMKSEMCLNPCEPRTCEHFVHLALHTHTNSSIAV